MFVCFDRLNTASECWLHLAHIEVWKPIGSPAAETTRTWMMIRSLMDASCCMRVEILCVTCTKCVCVCVHVC